MKLILTAVVVAHVIPAQTTEQYATWARAVCEQPDQVVAWFEANEVTFISDPKKFGDGCKHRMFLDIPILVHPFPGLFLSNGHRLVLEELSFANGEIRYRIKDVIRSDDT